MSPQRGSELAIASPPSSTTASPLAKHYVAAPKKQSISSTAPDTPTSKCSIVPAEDDSVNPISLPMSQSATNTAIKRGKDSSLSAHDALADVDVPISKSTPRKRGRPSQSSPTVKKLFAEDKDSQNKATDIAPDDA
ncbi:hypothetical protein OsI_11070 [Oryza sativa Indica Group]|uniref:Uncharacterized protein n=1 Tax=Oryza sativa subsp. indica TaxID=39946 RepID=A2XFC6_ORYSI|nr:hypothetical protein OsI_11070 [Oryza sativa Indica Group]